jgi:hypothetical protein
MGTPVHSYMGQKPENPDDPRRAIRRAPASGDVVPARPRPPAREVDDDPSEEDLARLDSETRTCPACGRDVFDDAEICYHCGHHFLPGERAIPWLQIMVAGVVLLAFVAVIAFNMF